MFLFGGIFLYVMFLLNIGPDNGWFSYPPLAGPEFGYGKRADVWAQLITFTEVSSLVVAICADLHHPQDARARDVAEPDAAVRLGDAGRQSFMVIFAMPAVMVASTCLILDRLVEHALLQPGGGRRPAAVAAPVLVLRPPRGLHHLPAGARASMSEIIATFSRRPVFGYLAMVLSLVATAFIGFGVWVHHMFATGLPQLGQSFFTAASIMIVVPTALQIFCWIATIWTARGCDSRRRCSTSLGFFFVFIIGGLTGVMLAVGAARPPGARHVLRRRALPLRADRRRRCSRCSAAFFYWFPKMTGRMLSERLGQLELLAAVRRLQPDVLPDARPRARRDAAARLHLSGGDGLGRAEPAGDASARRVMFAVAARLPRQRHRQPAARAPSPATIRGARSTLEWATSSPPPPYNFFPQPTVAGREPLWHPELSPPAIVGLRLRQAARCW